MSIRPLLALVLLAGCVPSKGQLTIYGDSSLADSARGRDTRIVLNPDRGSGPRPETAPPKPDGTSVTPDTKPPPPATPQPPFGNTLNTTAFDFSGIPDCADKQYKLYDLFGKTKGVLIAMMSPS